MKLKTQLYFKLKSKYMLCTSMILQVKAQFFTKSSRDIWGADQTPHSVRSSRQKLNDARLPSSLPVTASSAPDSQWVCPICFAVSAWVLVVVDVLWAMLRDLISSSRCSSSKFSDLLWVSSASSSASFR